MAGQFAVTFINIQPDLCIEAEMKKERDKGTSLCMVERDGMFSQGPALPWKQDASTRREKLFKYKKGGLQAVLVGDEKL
jgi:hypothetical protein